MDVTIRESALRAALRDLGRALGGAILFAVPLLMTMEMWQLGGAMDRLRLALFMLATIPILFGLSYYSGFERTKTRREDLIDTFVAYGVGFVASAAILTVLAMIGPAMPMEEVLGKIGIQAVPASIGAMLARKQLQGGEMSDPDKEESRRRATYGGELFLMLAGAIFVAFNVAPTEEMILIAYTMTPWHAIALAVLSLAALHAFVYTVGFAGQEARPEDAGFWRTFLHFTVAGYGIALLVSLYTLWTFERTDGTSPEVIAMMVVVLGFPAALGAATARLII